MNDPILEALSFSLNSDLEVGNIMMAPPTFDRAPGGSTSQTSSRSICQTQKTQRNPHLPASIPPKNSKSILPSSVILGEHHKTPCLLPGCAWISEPVAIKANKDTYLAHILSDHRMVIDDVDKIANLHKYVIYWKKKFESAPLKEFCVGFQMDELPKPEERHRKSVTPEDKPATEMSQSSPKEKPMYYMLTPALPEDKELRSKIWNSRLEAILEVNRQEREQQDFSRQCLLCKEVFTGNRTSLFSHMKTDHSFHIGKPDNIVFIEEFLELIADKLDKLICLYCEKVFKDKPVLRDHMRKKGHKRLNSDNPEYDRYYLVNYLEPGKDWKALEEDPEDERVEEEWTEAHDEKSSIVCLFCSHQATSFDEVLEHIKADHKFDFLQTTSTCDFYQKVKIVNFIRRTVFLNTCLYCEKKFLERTSLIRHIAEHGQKGSSVRFPPSKVWDQAEYFFPTYENDQFLVFLDKDNAEENDGSSVISTEDELLVIPEDPPRVNLSNFNPHNLDMDTS